MRTRATGVHKVHSTFSASGGVLSFYRDTANTQFAFGEGDEGLDVKFYGDTASAYVLWDESTDTLLGASSATFNWLGTLTASGATTFSGLTIFTSSITLNEMNITLSTSTGTEIGTGTDQKLGFYGATPATQQEKGDFDDWSYPSDVAKALAVIGLVDEA